jgi:hypothetical protein
MTDVHTSLRIGSNQFKKMDSLPTNATVGLNQSVYAH